MRYDFTQTKIWRETLFFLRIFHTKCLPDTVEHRSIGEYSHVEVGNKDSVHATLSLVPGPQHRINLHLYVTRNLDLAECGLDLAERGMRSNRVWIRSSRMGMRYSRVVDEI
jgi:hypothetical protein